MSAPRRQLIEHEEIDNLSLNSKRVFAAACARIIWDLYPPDKRSKASPELEKGLCAAENPSEAQNIRRVLDIDSLQRNQQEKALANVRDVVNGLDLDLDSPAAAISPALELALLLVGPHVGPWSDEDKQKAASLARATYSASLRLAKTLHTPVNHPAGQGGANTEAEFLKRARSAYDVFAKGDEESSRNPT